MQKNWKGKKTEWGSRWAIKGLNLEPLHIRKFLSPTSYTPMIHDITEFILRTSPITAGPLKSTWLIPLLLLMLAPTTVATSLVDNVNTTAAISLFNKPWALWLQSGGCPSSGLAWEPPPRFPGGWLVRQESQVRASTSHDQAPKGRAIYRKQIMWASVWALDPLWAKSRYKYMQTSRDSKDLNLGPRL